MFYLTVILSLISIIPYWLCMLLTTEPKGTNGPAGAFVIMAKDFLLSILIFGICILLNKIGLFLILFIWLFKFFQMYKLGFFKKVH